MEERYSRLVRSGDAFVSLQEIVDGQLAITVGRWWGNEEGEMSFKEQHLVVRLATMDLLGACWETSRRAHI